MAALKYQKQFFRLCPLPPPPLQRSVTGVK